MLICHKLVVSYEAVVLQACHVSDRNTPLMLHARQTRTCMQHQRRVTFACLRLG